MQPHREGRPDLVGVLGVTSPVVELVQAPHVIEVSVGDDGHDRAALSQRLHRRPQRTDPVEGVD